jgi:hypothetical protein
MSWTLSNYSSVVKMSCLNLISFRFAVHVRQLIDFMFLHLRTIQMMLNRRTERLSLNRVSKIGINQSHLYILDAH